MCCRGHPRTSRQPPPESPRTKASREQSQDEDGAARGESDQSRNNPRRCLQGETGVETSTLSDSGNPGSEISLGIDLIVVQAQAAAKHHLAQLADHVKMIQSSGSHQAPIFLRDMSQGRNQNRPYMSHIAAKSHAFTQRIKPSTRVRPAHFDRKHNGRQQVLETS